MMTLADVIAVLEKFRSMSFDEYLSLQPQERGFIAGCIMGNYGAHHPKECFEILKKVSGR